MLVLLSLDASLSNGFEAVLPHFYVHDAAAGRKICHDDRLEEGNRGIGCRIGWGSPRRDVILSERKVMIRALGS